MCQSSDTQQFEMTNETTTAMENGQPTDTVTFDVVKSASASVLLGQASTLVYASLVGPTEVRHNRDNAPAKLTVEINVYLLRNMEGSGQERSRGKGSLHQLQSQKQQQLESIIASVVESCVRTGLHPRSAVRIVLQEVESGKCPTLACFINAACLVLADCAGLALRTLFGAVSVRLTWSDDNDQPKFDVIWNLPDVAADADESSCLITFVFDSDSRLICCQADDNACRAEHLATALEVASGSHANLLAHLQNHLCDRLS